MFISFSITSFSSLFESFVVFFIVSVPLDCDLNINTASSCMQNTAAPSGTLTATFSTASKVNKVILGIVATCPNTQIKVSCSAIGTDLSVSTVSQQHIDY